MPFLGIELKLFISLVIFVESGFLIGWAGTFLVNRGKEKQEKKNHWLKYYLYFAIVHGMLFCGLFMARIDMIILSIILGFCLFELLTVGSDKYLKMSRKKRVLSVGIFLTCSVSTLEFYWAAGQRWFLFIYTLIAVLDAYSQIAGQLFGKHKLAPKISPNKTIEGVVGGSLVCLFCAAVIFPLVDLSLPQSLGLALLCTVVGTLSDLGASFYKRTIGVKDYSTLIPGHGGFVDRFNSFIGVSAVMGLCYFIFVFIKIWK